MTSINKIIWHKNSTPHELFPLLRALGEDYPIYEHGNGKLLNFNRVFGAGIVSRVQECGDDIFIDYNSITGAARAIGAVLGGVQGRNVFSGQSLGIMLDLSRNMVMKYSQLKKWLRCLALAGYNQLHLYCEDTYTLADEPMFGYMRGAYSLDELRSLDEYATDLGIELIGSIQTLGHCEQFLHWENYKKLKENERVMLVDDPNVLKLIEKMICFWHQALKSRRIHIGMDEAYGLGRDRFYDLHGEENSFNIFSRHLSAVNGICKKYDMHPMIWSDMYFRMSNAAHEYYDLSQPIPDVVKKQIPNDVQLVYWDYYHNNSEFYKKMLQAHRGLKHEPIMASGIWTWTKLWYDHDITKRTILPCVQACQELQIPEIIFTMWGDDGAYCNYDSALAGVFFAADAIYGINDKDITAKRFNAVCKNSYSAILAASEINYRFKKDEDLKLIYPSSILWDDPLQGIYYTYCKKIDSKCFDRMSAKLEKILTIIKTSILDDDSGNLLYATKIIQAVIKKIMVQSHLEIAYEHKDFGALSKLVDDLIPDCINAMQQFDDSFREQWLRCAKPFGLERIQARNAAQIARLNEARRRLKEYLNGKVDQIDELEEHSRIDSMENSRFHIYKNISSSSWII